MPKSSNQKLKILYVLKILWEKTDESHVLSINEILSLLEAYGIKAERKSLYDDFESLRAFGFDIESRKEKTTGYYVASRNFELPELKLLVDTVQSSKFITPKKSLELIRKIESQVSTYDAAKLQRQVHVLRKVKTMNESIYYNVDSIHDAISNDSQITFKYFEWNEKKEKVFRHEGALYNVSPFALCYDDENYYLIAYDINSSEIRHYRVDKMANISVLPEKRIGKEEFEKIDMGAYTDKIFGMFSGREEIVTLRCDNSLAGVIIDRFGAGVNFIKSSQTEFEFTVKVEISPLFLSWVIGFGKKMKVISPDSVITDIVSMIKEASENYN